MLKASAPKFASLRIWSVSRRFHRSLPLSGGQPWRPGPPTHKPASDRSPPEDKSLTKAHRRSMSTRNASTESEQHLYGNEDATRVERPKPTVEVIGHGGQKTKREINASYPNKPKAVENLLKRLSALHLLDKPSGTAYNSHGWELDPSGYILHRYTSFKSHDDLKQARREIDQAALELNHDPHILEEVTKDINIPCMLISCTTHYPAGLSVKDVKLAKEVDEILERIGERDDTKDAALSKVEMLRLREEAYTHNLANIDHVCKCARGH